MGERLVPVAGQPGGQQRQAGQRQAETVGDGQPAPGG
jgi:hypothetical protein